MEDQINKNQLNSWIIALSGETQSIANGAINFQLIQSM